MRKEYALTCALCSAVIFFAVKLYATIPASPSFNENPFAIEKPLQERPVPTSDRWNDALSGIKQKDNTYFSLGRNSMGDSYTSVSQNTEFEKARSVILIHLLKIKQSEQLFDTVLMEKYWKEVFAQANATDLFDTGRSLVSEALAAGIKPYREGKTLAPSDFADRAMKALGMTPIEDTGAFIILFKP